MTSSSSTKIPPALSHLIDKMARVAHEHWLGLERNDGKNSVESDPDALNDTSPESPSEPVIYDELSDEDVLYNKQTAEEVIRFIIDEGFRIAPRFPLFRRFRHHTLPHQLVESSEKLSARVHEQWRAKHLENGWTYAEKRDDVNKKHPDLIDYDQLSEETKDYDRVISYALLSYILNAGYVILPDQVQKAHPWDIISYISHNPKQYIDYWIAKGGCVGLCVLILLPVLLCFVISLGLYGMYFACSHAAASLVQEVNGHALIEIARDNNHAENIRGIVLHLLDPGYLYYNMEEPSELQAIAFVITLMGMVVVNGFLISSIVNYFARKRDDVEKGLVTYSGLRDHVVLIGYSEMSLSIIKEALQSPKEGARHPRQVLILSNQDIEHLRPLVFSQLDDGQEYRVIFYAGSYEAEENINRLSLPTTSSIYVTGEENISGRDSKNIECLHQIAKRFRAHSLPIRTDIYLQYDRLSSASVSHHLDFSKNIFRRMHLLQNEINLYTFNFCENWARLLWSSYAKWSSTARKQLPSYHTLDRDELTDEKYVHLIIIGFNRMGRALLLEALRICHYRSKKPTRITLVDPKMDEKKRFFEAQYPRVGEYVHDICIDYRKGWAEEEAMRRLIHDAACDDDQILTIAVCVRDADTSLAIGLNLPEPVYYQKRKTKTAAISAKKHKILANSITTQILIRQEIQGGMAQQLDLANSRYKNVRSFGMLNAGFSSLMIDDTLGMLIHHQYCDEEAYVTMKAQKLETRLGYLETRRQAKFADERKAWRKLSEVDRWSNRYQVDMFDYYTRSLSTAGIDSIEKLYDQIEIIAAIEKNEDKLTHQEQKDKLSENILYQLALVEHRRWMAERSIIGWRQKQEAQDGAEKEERIDEMLIHHDMIDFDHLDTKTIYKDINPVVNSSILSQFYEKCLTKENDPDEREKR